MADFFILVCLVVWELVTISVAGMLRKKGLNALGPRKWAPHGLDDVDAMMDRMQMSPSKKLGDEILIATCAVLAGGLPIALVFDPFGFMSLLPIPSLSPAGHVTGSKLPNISVSFQPLLVQEPEHLWPSRNETVSPEVRAHRLSYFSSLMLLELAASVLVVVVLLRFVKYTGAVNRSYTLLANTADTPRNDQAIQGPIEAERNKDERAENELTIELGVSVIPRVSHYGHKSGMDGFTARDNIKKRWPRLGTFHDHIEYRARLVDCAVHNHQTLQRSTKDIRCWSCVLRLLSCSALHR
jgi:hypothetical protein